MMKSILFGFIFVRRILFVDACSSRVPEGFKVYGLDRRTPVSEYACDKMCKQNGYIYRKTFWDERKCLCKVGSHRRFHDESTRIDFPPMPKIVSRTTKKTTKKPSCDLGGNTVTASEGAAGGKPQAPNTQAPSGNNAGAAGGAKSQTKDPKAPAGGTTAKPKR